MAALVFEEFLSTPEMLDTFGAAAFVQAMLDVEAALARAQAAHGLMPAAAGEAIAAACDVLRIDVAAVVAASGRAGSLAIPLVKHLTEAVARDDVDAARHVHVGSTSQDVIDTAMVLVTRRALALIDRDLAALIEALLALVRRHGDAPMLGRTLLQPAQVVSFGFAALAWIAPLVRCRERLRVAAGNALQLQLGGAVGTLAVMGERGTDVARHMAEALRLRLPVGAWQTQRDEWVALGCEVGVLCGAVGKLAKDVSLLAQAEIGEVAEPSGAGRGGSSAMPHKRNPVSSMVALAAALRAPQRVAALLAAMPQEHQRGLGNWQAELAEWAGLFISAHGAVAAMRDACAGLHVDAPRMRRNIDALQGLTYGESAAAVVAKIIGKAAAHALFERLSQRTVAENADLRDIALAAVDADDALRRRVEMEALAACFDADTAALPARRTAAAQLAFWAGRAAALAPFDPQQPC